MPTTDLFSSPTCFYHFFLAVLDVPLLKKKQQNQLIRKKAVLQIQTKPPSLIKESREKLQKSLQNVLISTSLGKNENEKMSSGRAECHKLFAEAIIIISMAY